MCNAETWDANIFCQERNQLFKLSGYLHDQVELTDTGRSLTETTSRASHSPRARPAAARAAATRNHQQAARPEPHANHVNHRAPPANPRPDNVQVHLSHLLFTSASVIVLPVVPRAECRSTICSLHYGTPPPTTFMLQRPVIAVLIGMPKKLHTNYDCRLLACRSLQNCNRRMLS